MQQAGAARRTVTFHTASPSSVVTFPPPVAAAAAAAAAPLLEEGGGAEPHAHSAAAMAAAEHLPAVLQGGAGAGAARAAGHTNTELLKGPDTPLASATGARRTRSAPVQRSTAVAAYTCNGARPVAAEQPGVFIAGQVASGGAGRHAPQGAQLALGAQPDMQAPPALQHVRRRGTTALMFQDFLRTFGGSR